MKQQIYMYVVNNNNNTGVIRSDWSQSVSVDMTTNPC